MNTEDIQSICRQMYAVKEDIKWVWIADINKMKKADWKKYLHQSYELVKAKLPAKKRKELGLV